MGRDAVQEASSSVTVRMMSRQGVMTDMLRSIFVFVRLEAVRVECGLRTGQFLKIRAQSSFSTGRGFQCLTVMSAVGALV